jgi:hypothetical protein
MPPQEKAPRPNEHHDDGLHSAGSYAGETHGDAERDHMVRSTSVYNTLMKHPVVATGVAVAVGAAVIGVLRFLNQPQPTTGQKVKTYATDAIAHATKTARQVAKNLQHKNRGFFN